MADRYKVSVDLVTEDGLHRTIGPVPVRAEVGAIIYLLAFHPFDAWNHELTTLANFRLWLKSSLQNRGRDCAAGSVTSTDLGDAGDTCDG